MAPRSFPEQKSHGDILFWWVCYGEGLGRVGSYRKSLAPSLTSVAKGAQVANEMEVCSLMRGASAPPLNGPLVDSDEAAS